MTKLVLAFDRGTENRWGILGDWSILNELRRALRELHNLPIFSIFLSTLSTTAKIYQSVGSTGPDFSSRILKMELTLVQPFTDVGVDHLAKRIALDGNWDLDKLTDDAYICSLGRPL